MIRRRRRCHNNKTHPFLSVFALLGKTDNKKDNEGRKEGRSSSRTYLSATAAHLIS